jgi:phenylpropionate dioxygenase-like ring-hydroxylating dioxygenase large terminal subunit
MTQSYWQAVARASDVGRKPVRVHFSGRPIVIFRTATGLHALFDRCPHRHVELSKGKVVGETIECPYHGWRFNGAGVCVDIPGCLGAIPAVRVPNLAICEREGGIFLAQGDPQADPVVHPMQHDTCVRQIVRSETKSTLVDAAENILDATHTHYTHKGLLRGLSAKRQKVTVALEAGPDWVEAVYTGEDKQDGLVSRLLDGARTKTVGRFRHPGIAELEYWGPRGLVLATSFHLRQVGSDKVEGVGCWWGRRKTG